MGKFKKGKNASADAVYAKKRTEKINPFTNDIGGRKLNPFEVHVNKEKFQILGRKCKHDKGLPGVSRAKAVRKRKETLGQEFQQKHKTNQFRDRRIGKNFTGAQLSDDVINARFMAEKMSQMKQSKAISRFNLNDDEVLTHRGQTLEDIEQFYDERSDEEDEDDEGLNAEFTETANFGGDENTAQVKDRKTAIEDMIVEQKRRKIEIAKEKDEIHELTEKLDDNYKDLIGLMGKLSKSEIKEKKSQDDFDKIMREMVFEPRGVVTDKLLSEEETAKREKERLEQLEKERQKRMLADGEELEQNPQPKHRSADDLDDGYFAYGQEEEDITLTYNLDGELGSKFATNGENDSEEECSNDDGSEEENSSGDNDNNSDDEENDDEEEDDNLSDLKDSDRESDGENPTTNELNTEKPVEKKSDTKPKKSVNTERNDIPFTIEMPLTYAKFSELLGKRMPEDQAIIVERLIKCNHPKLDGVNREKVVQLFSFLLQHINELFADATQENIALNFKTLSHLNPYLYDLLHLNPERMSSLLLNVIKEKYAAYCKNPKVFPTIETIIYFKLVSNYFSTSDFRHPIVTPCYIFIQHILSRARLRTRQDIALGLFLVTIVLEYSQQSKRFLPAALNFLLGIVYIAIPKRPIEILKIVPPFQSTGPMSKLLTLAESVETATLSNSEETLLSSDDLVMITFSTEFRIRALNITLKLISDAVSIVGDNVGANYLAQPLLDMLERLPLDVYPKYVHANFEATKATLIKVATKSLTKIVPPEKKPKALRLLEPRIETVYDDKRRPKLSKEKEERVKLMHKLKRETKGAVREIRRDTEFLQKIRIQQQIQSDMERKEKVKRIYQEAAMQQGELNELARAKKKRKF